MKVSEELIDRLCKLSKLEFGAEEKQRIKTDLERMLALVEQLNELDTSAVEPLIHVSDEVNVLRNDVVSEKLTQSEALKNAPHHDEFYFKVPKVVDNPGK